MEVVSPSAEGLASLPGLVLEAVWHRLSYAARRNLRATCRALCLRVDAELIRTAMVASYDSPPRTHPSSLAPSLPSCHPPLQLPTEVRWLLDSAGYGSANSHDPVTDPASRQKHAGGAAPAASSPVAAVAPASPPLAGPPPAAPTAALFATTASHSGTSRFHSLHTLILAPLGGGGGNAAAGLPAALQPFLHPPPAARLLPFAASSACLTHLVLLDPLPGPSERDIAAISAAFPALASLQLLTSPGHAGARAVVPPLGSLRACARLRSLALDLGRSGVLGAGCRSSLGMLTQLTRLVLGLADTSGDEVETAAATAAAAAAAGCCGCCRSAAGASLHHHPAHQYHHHHLHRVCCAPHRQEAGCAALQWQGAVAAAPSSTGGGGSEPGGGGCVVAAMVGGVEASLYTLARANLRSLELRVVSFGAYYRRLLHAVAAGGAAAVTAAAAVAAAAAAGDSDVAGGDGGGGLQHLCLRLMPTPHHAAPTSASFAAGGSAGLGGAFGGGGLGGLGTPSASLSCGPLALGDAAATPVAAVGWAQPSESEQMLAALPALPGLERLEVPELLFTTTNHLTRCLTTLTRLTELRVGGVVAAAVPAPRPTAPPAAEGRRGGLAVLPALRSLAVEAESPSYGGGAVVPWWSVVCPALHRLSLTLQYGNAPGTTLGGGRYDSQPAGEQLAAALARVREVRLVVCVAGRALSSTAVAMAGYGIAGRGRGGGCAPPLSKDLHSILRRSGTVRHLELHVADPSELYSCLSEDLLAPADATLTDVAVVPPAAGCGAAWGEATAAAGGDRRPAGVETLRLASLAGWEAAGTVAAVAEGATLLCNLLARVLAKASPALDCICLSVPGLWGAADGCGGGGGDGGPGSWGGCAELRRQVMSALEELVGGAAARGTRLCLLCGASSDARAALLQALERAGLEVAEKRCPGCALGSPVHCVI